MSRRSGSAVGIAGVGAAGSALACALVEAGWEVRVWDRNQAKGRRLANKIGCSFAPGLRGLLEGVDLVILAVSDPAITSLALQLAAAWPETRAPQTVLHTAGAWPSTLLHPLRRRSALGVFHPVAALTGLESAPRLSSSFVTLSGDPPAIRSARRLARSLRMTALTVDDSARALVHLACVMAAGDLVALLGVAEGLLGQAGLPSPKARRLLARLASGAVEGFDRQGPIRALTGPVARGDEATLTRHREALADLAPRSSAGVAHPALVTAAVEILSSANRIDPASARRLRKVLSGWLSEEPAPRTLPRRNGRPKILR